MVEFKNLGKHQKFDPSWRDVVVLNAGTWDDWFQFETLHSLSYVDTFGKRIPIGSTKIGQTGLLPDGKDSDARPGYRRPTIPDSFESLSPDHFSLGQDSSYYENLTRIGAEFREDVLDALGDLAYRADLREHAKREAVTGKSLLREVPWQTVVGQFDRLARGGARLTPYFLTFPLPNQNLALEFSVTPESLPPTNINVLIGRNGVGKSTLLNSIALNLLDLQNQAETSAEGWAGISNLVSVSFSAFDVFEPISVPRNRSQGLTCHYVGLKKVNTKREEPSTPKDPAALSRELSLSAKVCLAGPRRPRLRRALELLEADPIFADSGLVDLIVTSTDDALILDRLPQIFKLLSSGHKIVLLTIVKLVETVEEKSLVLLDEPEAHLHPPLLSAFIRALSDLLTNRNGMAIVATHSPVVLQEVPKSCVWKLHRSGSSLKVERPSLETFGENVGILTDEIFGLEVTATGFHRLLAETAQDLGSYDEVLEEFNGQIGAEGRAVLRAMFNALRNGRNVAR